MQLVSRKGRFGHGERGPEQAAITDAGRTAVTLDLIGMNGKDFVEGEEGQRPDPELAVRALRKPAGQHDAVG
jgi:hypothetical protein